MDKKKIARKIAEESIVLLKNANHILPLKEKKEIAFFGRTQTVSYTHLTLPTKA